MSASFDLPIDPGVQNFRGETATASVMSLIIGQGSQWPQHTKSEKEFKQRKGREGHLVLRGEKGALWALWQPVFISRGDSELGPAVRGVVVGWSWMKSQHRKGKCEA